MKYSFETTSETCPHVSLWPATVNEIRNVISFLKSKKLCRYVGVIDIIIQKLHRLAWCPNQSLYEGSSIAD
jgi:hypothetical protein